MESILGSSSDQHSECSDKFSDTPPSIILPDLGATSEEEEIYEYFAVEEIPKRLNIVSPIYPEMAKRASIEGTVNLKVLVSKTGTVDSVDVVEGPNIFIKSAIEAARATKFIPAKLNDRPVACWALMPFKFVMEK